MLGDEHGMLSHGCLPPVIGRLRRRQARGHEPLGVFQQDREAALPSVFADTTAQPESLVKARTLQGG